MEIFVNFNLYLNFTFVRNFVSGNVVNFKFKNLKRFYKFTGF